MKKFLSVLLSSAIFICSWAIKASALGIYDISAECAALVCVETGELLFEKNAHRVHSMASTTKIMTSLLAVEEYTPQREITVTSQMLKVEGTSMGLLAGDTVTLEGLVYGMLLPSGNDAANVVAYTLAGSTEDFAVMMNNRARQIGMKNTNFVTPSGLDDKNHYSTAYDMALLGCEAVKNKEFASICSQKSATVSYGNPPYKRTLTNHNRLLKSYDGAFGIKTGFTKKSGRCLVSGAERNGVRLVAVTLNAPDDWQDHKKMLDFGFEQVESTQTDFKLDNIIVPVVGGTVNTVSVNCKNIQLVGNVHGYETVLLIDKFLYAPVSAGQVVGEIRCIKDGKVIASSPVTAKTDVPIFIKQVPEKEKINRNQKIINHLRRNKND